MILNLHISDTLARTIGRKPQAIYVKYHPKVILSKAFRINFEQHFSDLSFGIIKLHKNKQICIEIMIQTQHKNKKMFTIQDPEFKLI